MSEHFVPATKTAPGISRRVLIFGAIIFLLTCLLFTNTSLLRARAEAGKVLILAPTVVGGSSSLEAQAAIALGYQAEVVDAATWSAKTTADFASYRALILGDPNDHDIGHVTAAEATKSIWGPAVTGNVIIIGSDPVSHQSRGGRQLINSGVKFAADQAGKTGMYIALSEYYHNTRRIRRSPCSTLSAPAVLRHARGLFQ